MFKNLIALRITNTVTQKMLMSDEFVELVQNNISEPPAASQWRKFGFSQPDCFGAAPVADVTKGVRVFCVRAQERILPGTVIGRKLSLRISELMQLENRSLTKREIAQLKDSVIAELLPNSHIRDKDTLIMVTPGWVMVDTGSAKVMEDVISYLRETIMQFDEFPDSWKSLQVTLMKTEGTADFLRDLANGNFIHDQNDEGLLDDDEPLPGPHFRARDSITLKGDGVIRLRDIAWSDPEFKEALSHGRSIVELGMSWGRKHDVVDLHCTLNDHMIIRKLKFSDILLNQLDEENHESAVSYFHGSVIIVADILRKFIDQLVQVTTEEDEDEL